MLRHRPEQIGEIGTDKMRLWVYERHEKHYWRIGNGEYEEIPRYLYDAIIKAENERILRSLK